MSTVALCDFNKARNTLFLTVVEHNIAALLSSVEADISAQLGGPHV